MNNPYPEPPSWQSMSMGEGRRLPPSGKCPDSPDGKHHYVSDWCVQSVEHFVCDYCKDEFTD